MAVPGPVADGRIPMSDGAGVIEAVGGGVTQFRTGAMSSPLFSRLDQRRALSSRFRDDTGRRRRRLCARAVVTCAVIHACAEGMVACRGGDHYHGGPHRVAGAHRQRRAEGGRHGAGAGHGRRLDRRPATGKAMGATVIATSSSDEKRARLEAMGASPYPQLPDHAGLGRAGEGLDGRTGR